MLLGSGGPGRPLKCIPCDLWSSSYDYWLSHLSSESHQVKVFDNGHEAWIEDKDCCLQVTEVKDISIQLLIAYLAKFGTIVDLVRQQDERRTEFYFVKYDSQEPVKKILTGQKKVAHQIQGKQIFFRRKYEYGQGMPELGSLTKRSNQAQDSNSSTTGRTDVNGPAVSSIGLLASEYWESNDDDDQTALESLQTMYTEEEEEELLKSPESETNLNQEPMVADPDSVIQEDRDENEQKKTEEHGHDLFSTKMIEHLSNILSDMTLEDQLETFCQNIILSGPFLEGRHKLAQELSALIKSRYPKCTLYPFGMDHVGIGNNADAVHLHVDLFDNVLSVHKQPWEINSPQHWNNLFQILKVEQDNLRFCSKVSKTEDIINFTHVESGIIVTLNISSPRYALVQEASLLKFYSTLDPRVRPLLALIRYWSSTNAILDSLPENTNGRFLVLLMLFHLSNRNVIPTLAKLQSEKPDRKIIHEGIDLSFSTDTSKLPPPNTLILQDKSIMALSTMSLLQDFFQRFGMASLKDNALSLWYGKFIKKSDLTPQNQKNLPDDFATKLRIGPDGDISKKSLNFGDSEHQFCVQDLFDPSLNLTLNIDNDGMKKFQIMAWKTGEKLERVLNSSKPYLMNIFLTTAEDERIEQEREAEKQRQFQEMHKQVQQEQQRLLQIKNANELEEKQRKDRQLEEERIQRQRKIEEEELLQQRRKIREEEERAQRLQREDDDRRRRLQREREEERQRFIKNEEMEKRLFIQKQQGEQRFQRQSEIERQRELEKQQQIQNHKLKGVNDRAERLPHKPFQQDQWSAPQVMPQNNSGPNSNKVNNRTTFGDSSTNPNYFPLGPRRNLSNTNKTSLIRQEINGYNTNQNNDNNDDRYDDRYKALPPNQVTRRDPIREPVGIINHSISNAITPAPKDPKKMDQDDWLNTEWEEFSKSLEQPTLQPPSSFLNYAQKKPVAPVAPSQKMPILRNPNLSMYSEEPPPPPPPKYPRMQPYGGGVSEYVADHLSLGVTAAKGPLRYEDGGINTGFGQEDTSHGKSTRRQSTEFLDSETSDDSSSSEDEKEDEQEEDDYEIPIENSRLINPYPVPKMTLCPFIKNLFCQAIESNDFAYGIRGKLQTLFLQFMKEFNNRFWKKCFGFEIELDPTYQDTSPADYAKFGEKKSAKMTDLLNSVPCFEENFTTTFFCQSSGKLSTLLTHAQPSDLRNSKFIRKQSTPMLKVLMDEVPAHLVCSSQNLRFKVEVSIVLDYTNLNKQCRPYVKISFDKGLSTQTETLALFQFFGKLYNKMGTRFLTYCFKRWLASCIDFDMKTAERKCMLLKHQNIESGKALSKKQRRGLRRLKRAEKKKQKKMMEFQATSWAASTVPPPPPINRPNVGSGDYEIGSRYQQPPVNSMYSALASGVGKRSSSNLFNTPQPQPPLTQYQQEFQQHQQPPAQQQPLLGQQGGRGGRFVPGRGKTFQIPPNWNRTMNITNPNPSPNNPPNMYRRQF